MIRVLQSFDEVERAVPILKEKGFGYHGDPLKNWDLLTIMEILERYERDICVLDMGCGGTACAVLRVLYNRGFTNCYGIDLSISMEDKLMQVWLMIKNKTLRVPFRLTKGDLTKTRFSSESFDFIICLSVIEHGVDVGSFLKEAGRLLKTHGMLYVSTDYWEPKIPMDFSLKPLGLDWKIFSKKEIQGLIDVAKKYDLRMDGEQIPPVKEKVVHWGGKDYTTISLIFNKQ